MHSPCPQAASRMLSRTSNIGSRLMQLHTRLASSAQPYSSATAAASSAVATQHHQQELQLQQQQSSLIRPSLNPPVFQERINSDGSLTTGPQREQEWRQRQIQRQPQQPGISIHPPSSSSNQEQYQDQEQQAFRPPGVPVAAPAAAPISHQQLEQLVDLIQGAQRVVVVTGAGCSTESNIPDYRGPRGAYTTGECDQI